MSVKAIRFVVGALLACLGNCLVAATPVAARQGAPQPNIIDIVADDLGWKDVGFHGSDMKSRKANLSPKPFLKADKEKGIIVLDSETQLSDRRSMEL
jgi:hypothetical protein